MIEDDTLIQTDTTNIPPPEADDLFDLHKAVVASHNLSNFDEVRASYQNRSRVETEQGPNHTKRIMKIGKKVVVIALIGTVAGFGGLHVIDGIIAPNQGSSVTEFVNNNETGTDVADKAMKDLGITSAQVSDNDLGHAVNKVLGDVLQPSEQATFTKETSPIFGNISVDVIKTPELSSKSILNKSKANTNSTTEKNNSGSIPAIQEQSPPDLNKPTGPEPDQSQHHNDLNSGVPTGPNGPMTE